MRGYFFSLETVIAILIILSSILVIHFNQIEFDNKKEKIYTSLNILEQENNLRSKTNKFIEHELREMLDFDVSVDKNCTGRIIDYLLVEGKNKFRIIRVCY